MSDRYGRSQWQNTFIWLAPLHEGLPDWSPRLFSYALRSLQGRDRFNLYNAYRAINETGDIRLYTQQFREALNRFDEHGIRFSGPHAQKVILDKRLISFWSCFLIPAHIPAPADLSIFYAELSKWRFDELVTDPILKHFLPAGFRSLTKKNLIMHLLRVMFSDPKQYARFVSKQQKRLSSEAAELYARLGKGPMLMREVSPDQDMWAAVCELCYVLLIRPAYVNQEGNLYLTIDFFRGFESPYQLPGTESGPVAKMEACLGPICAATRQMVQGQDVPLSAKEPGQTFPERQLNLFREKEKVCFEKIKLFLGWWRDAVGAGFLPREALPVSGFCLTRSCSGAYVPLILEEWDLNPMLDLAIEFGLVVRDTKVRLAITPLGRMAAATGKNTFNFAVKAVWARNVDRLTLSLGGDWSEDFNNLLNLVSTHKEDGRYELTPISLAECGLGPEEIEMVIGGFIRLNRRHLDKLRGWIEGSETGRLRAATAFPNSEEWIAERLPELLVKNPDWQIFRNEDYTFIIGPNPSQLRRELKG